MSKKPFFLCAVLAVTTFASLVFLPPLYSEKNSAETNVTIELWNVDTFEGGTGSRRDFLEKAAKLYAKSSNVTVAVKQQTVNSCKANFAVGIYPDVLSYGNGVELPYDRLCALSFGSGEVGKYGGARYAAAWCQGRYALISRAETAKVEGLIVSCQDYTIPLAAYCLSGEIMPKNVIYLQSKEAIYEFYGKKNYALLGTQRDLYRLENKGINYEARPLKGFCDLYQYVSVIDSGRNNIVAAQAFSSFLFTAEIQNALSSVGMLPSDGKDVFSETDAIKKLCGVSCDYAVDAFYTLKNIAEISEMCKNFAVNAENIKSALKYLN